MEFDNLNGFLIEKGEKLFDTTNRSLKYGDGVFETMKIVGKEILFWDDHYKRLKAGIDHLKIDDTGRDQDFFFNEIQRIIVKNYYKECKIRLIVYRDAAGLYTPMGNRLGFFIEGVRYDDKQYLFKPEGVKLGVYKEEFKAVTPLSNHKTTSANLFVLASIYKKEKELGDVVVLNTNGNVCEGSSSNIFIQIDGKVYTPSLAEGCLNGVMRKQVIKFLKQQDLGFEEGVVTLEMLEKAEEIFFTNTMVGVQGVSSFDGKPMNQSTTKKLQNYLVYLINNW